MILTVDTSAVLAVAVGESAKPALVEAVRGADLIAPGSLTAEIGNALSAMFKRKRVTLEDAERVIAVYRSIPLRLLDIDLTRALALAEKFGIYAYDAYVIDCALSTGTPLLSLDMSQRKVAMQAGVSLHPY